MANEKSSKDFWDIAETLSKIVSGVVLVVIAFFINRGAEKISRSNEETKILQTLIEDLTKKEEATRNDIALIALEKHFTEKHDNTKEPFDTAYFKSITETIFRQRIFTDTLFSPETSIPYKLLFKYDKKLADSIFTGFQAQRRRDTKTSDTNTYVSTADIKMVKPVSESRNEKEATVISSLNKKICYIQYSNLNNTSLLKKVRQQFIDTNWITPGFEYVPGTYKNTVKYFHPEDEETARKAISIAQKALGRNFAFELVPIFSKKYNVPKGQIEIWISN